MVGTKLGPSRNLMEATRGFGENTFSLSRVSVGASRDSQQPCTEPGTGWFPAPEPCSVLGCQSGKRQWEVRAMWPIPTAAITEVLENKLSVVS